MNSIHILVIVFFCYIQLRYYNRVQIIDVEWERVPHEEALKIYDQVLKGEIKIYEN